MFKLGKNKWKNGDTMMTEETILQSAEPTAPFTQGSLQITEERQQTDKITKEDIDKALTVLQKYKNDKKTLESRILEEEKWWDMRHWEVIGEADENRPKPTSAWLFNAVANKHADAMDNIPEPNILPREKSDEPEAKNLSAIIPAVLSHCGFEGTYSENSWAKLKHGTAVYGTFWNNDLEGGLGDVDVKAVDIFNVFCDMGVSDIGQSKNLFVLNLVDIEALEGEYPEHKGEFGNSSSIEIAKHAHQEKLDTTEKTIVYDWYYKQKIGNKTVVQYVKFANGIVLYASENIPELSQTGFYESGEYPITVDNLFTVPGTPFGFGLIAICKSPQMYIDKMDQLLLENASYHSKPRYFVSAEAGINEKEFLDISKALVHVEGSLSDSKYVPIDVPSIDGYAMNMLDYKITELKETVANNDANNGTTSSGVTSGAAISVLQEAGNKQSRDFITASYRAYKDIIYKIIELIRQFYTEERSFRVTGENGQIGYIAYTNENLNRPIDGYTGEVEDLAGYEVFKKAIFDIDVKPQKRSAYSKLSQNDLAIQLYQMGFFNPELAQQSSACVEMMDFDGKEKVKNLIAEGNAINQQIMAMQQQIAELTAMLGMGGGNMTVPQPVPFTQGSIEAGAEEQVGLSGADKMSYGEKLARKATVEV